MRLFEAFDSTYRIRQTGATDFSFTADNGTVYQITFFTPSSIQMAMDYQSRYFPLMPASPRSYAEVEFSIVIVGDEGGSSYKYLGGTEQIRNIGENPMKVFATVLNTVFWYVSAKHIDVLLFSGESKLGPLYERMIRRYMPKSHKMIKGTSRDPMRFIIYRSDLSLE
jgi:hypothetical protein